ncbi:hypothetical protein L6164_011766 [Bauhinia variegata]|uniref:Uncharacterized protein n=1 Tax=Bauhinia variegata TaxID=167791 RepID=A0ACB9P959_BAUVA|nr:hypothetical protein L6164_011766 [Bauhinia variegata]
MNPEKGSCSTVFQAESATPQRGYGDIRAAATATLSQGLILRVPLRSLSCIRRMGFILVFLGTETASCYQLRIFDFGSAKTLEEKRNFNSSYWKGRFRVTPLYMSPESVEQP